jgi:uncharacterized membrane protein YsdA (DUF1294 family)/cold shock CspA family protein
MQHRGTITEWNDAKGYGFVTPESGGARVFVHVSSLPRGRSRPRGGEVVVYEVGPGRAGKPQAVGVQYVGPTAPADPGRTASGAAWAAGAAFLAAITALALLGRAPLWSPLPYAVMSLFAFAAYDADKRKAQAGAWRTPEATLHLLEFLGGWPGALIAQRRFRHKTRKTEYQAVFWAIVLAHLGFWGWLLAGHPGLPR